MIALLIFSVLTIGLYTAMVTIRSGIPCSISETYYRIENKKWFTFVMLFTAFTLLPCALEISTDDSRFWFFLSVVGIAIVGISPNFIKGEKSEIITHYVGSVILLICSQMWVYFNTPILLFLWVLYLLVEITLFCRLPYTERFLDRVIRLKPVYWAEIIVMITIYCAVFRYAYLL